MATDDLPATDGNTIDSIADLLIGDNDENEASEESASSEESQLDTDEGQEHEADEADEDDEDESAEESESEPDDTWGSVLGLSDDAIVLDEEGNFKSVNVKIDGDASQVELKDLVAGYQSNKSNTVKSQLLADERREFESVRTNAVDSYTKKLDNVEALAQYMNKLIMSDFEAVDWNTLRASDPAEYAALNQDFQRRNQDLQNVYSAIQNDKTDEQNQLSTRSNTQLQQYLSEQMDIVIQNNPEWADKDKMAAGFSSLRSGLVEYGYKPEEFEGIQDARQLEILKDALAYRAGSKVAKKKISKPLPKYQKGNGKKLKPKVSKLDRLTSKANKATGSSKRAAQTDAVAELLLGGQP